MATLEDHRAFLAKLNPDDETVLLLRLLGEDAKRFEATYVDRTEGTLTVTVKGQRQTYGFDELREIGLVMVPAGPE